MRLNGPSPFDPRCERPRERAKKSSVLRAMAVWLERSWMRSGAEALLDGAADLGVDDGGELGEVDVGAFAGGVDAVLCGLEFDAVGAVGGDGGGEVGVADQVVRYVVV